MDHDELIEMKIAPQSSNPAKGQVMEATNDSVLSFYLREISNYPQLSAEEEKLIAQQILEQHLLPLLADGGKPVARGVKEHGRRQVHGGFDAFEAERALIL